MVEPAQFGDVSLKVNIAGASRIITVPTMELMWTTINFMQHLRTTRKVARLLDIGACCGSFSLAAVRAFGDVLIDAYEPSEWSWPYLVGNCSGIANIRCHHYAVSDTDGEIVLSMPAERDEPIPGLESAHGNGKWTQVVSAKRLDAVVDGPVDFMKIDVEGHELNVLQGSEAIIERYHPAIMIEIKAVRQKQANRTTKEVPEWLVRHGYGWPEHLSSFDWLFTMSQSC